MAKGREIFIGNSFLLMDMNLFVAADLTLAFTLVCAQRVAKLRPLPVSFFH